jgi:type IV pilus assembly protein PilB
MATEERIGDLLLKKGLITEEQLRDALEEQKKTHEKIGQILIQKGIISPSELSKLLSTQTNIPSVNMEEFSIDPNVVSLLPEKFIRDNFIIPLRKTDGTLEVACVPPINPEVLEDARLITGLRIKPFLITENEFEQALNRVYNLKARAEKVISALGGRSEQQNVIPIIPETATEDRSVVGLVNSILSDAISQNASDVHLDPSQFNTRVRYRIDGIMYNSITIPKEIADSVVSRIKVSAGMDIAERRRPQDGHFSAQYRNEFYDFRVSSIGTSYGEKLTIRILSKQKMLMPMERLGMLPEQFETFKKLIKMPYGIILVTGPTGSGKTTTLYSALSTLNTGRETIITLEDPVEYNLPGISQIQINEEAGITFASGLRSVLRLDPNIIMVGEIRDLDTAKTAVEASLTGHLVLASIHTNDTASTPVRLMNLGLEPYLIASSLIGVVAQRLVRVICPNCKEKYSPSEEESAIVKSVLHTENVESLYRGKGCPLCNFTGYKGRSGIFEILTVDRTLRRLIQQSASYDEIKDYAVRNGMITMREAGFRKVLSGVTTINEVERVVAEI